MNSLSSILVVTLVSLAIFSAVRGQTVGLENSALQGQLVADIVTLGPSPTCYDCNQAPAGKTYTATSCLSQQHACQVARMFTEMALFRVCNYFSCRSNVSGTVQAAAGLNNFQVVGVATGKRQATAAPTAAGTTTTAPGTAGEQLQFSQSAFQTGLQRCLAASTRNCRQSGMGPFLVPSSGCPNNGSAFVCTISCESSCQCNAGANILGTGQGAANLQAFGFLHNTIGSGQLEIVNGPSSQAMLVSNLQNGGGVNITVTPTEVSSLLVTMGIQRPSNQTLPAEQIQFTPYVACKPLVATVIEIIPAATSPPAAATAPPATASPATVTAPPGSQAVFVDVPVQVTTNAGIGAATGFTIGTAQAAATTTQAPAQTTTSTGPIASPFWRILTQSLPNQQSSDDSMGPLYSVTVQPLAVNLTNLRVEARRNGQVVIARSFDLAPGQNLPLAIIPDGTWAVNPFLPIDNSVWATINLPRAASVELFGLPIPGTCAAPPAAVIVAPQVPVQQQIIPVTLNNGPNVVGGPITAQVNTTTVLTAPPTSSTTAPLQTTVTVPVVTTGVANVEVPVTNVQVGVATPATAQTVSGSTGVPVTVTTGQVPPVSGTFSGEQVPIEGQTTFSSPQPAVFTTDGGAATVTTGTATVTTGTTTAVPVQASATVSTGKRQIFSAESLNPLPIAPQLQSQIVEADQLVIIAGNALQNCIPLLNYLAIEAQGIPSIALFNEFGIAPSLTQTINIIQTPAGSATASAGATTTAGGTFGGPGVGGGSNFGSTLPQGGGVPNAQATTVTGTTTTGTTTTGQTGTTAATTSSPDASFNADSSGVDASAGGNDGVSVSAGDDGASASAGGDNGVSANAGDDGASVSAGGDNGVSANAGDDGASVSAGGDDGVNASAGDDGVSATFGGK